MIEAHVSCPASRRHSPCRPQARRSTKPGSHGTLCRCILSSFAIVYNRIVFGYLKIAAWDALRILPGRRRMTVMFHHPLGSDCPRRRLRSCAWVQGPRISPDIFDPQFLCVHSAASPCWVCPRPSKRPPPGRPGFLAGGPDRAVAPEVPPRQLGEHGLYGPIMPLLVSANGDLFCEGRIHLTEVHTMGCAPEAGVCLRQEPGDHREPVRSAHTAGQAGRTVYGTPPISHVFRCPRRGHWIPSGHLNWNSQSRHDSSVVKRGTNSGGVAGYSAMPICTTCGSYLSQVDTPFLRFNRRKSSYGFSPDCPQRRRDGVSHQIFCRQGFTELSMPSPERNRCFLSAGQAPGYPRRQAGECVEK